MTDNNKIEEAKEKIFEKHFRNQNEDFVCIDHIEAVLKKSVDLLYGKDDSINENQQGKTTIYQIWCDHTTVSGGFVGGSNYPTQLMFTTLEKARQNKPENDYSTGNSRKYYIKEVEID